MFKYDWIWHKSKPSGMATAKKRPMTSHEIVSVFYKNWKFFPILEPRDISESSRKIIEKYKIRTAVGSNTSANIFSEKKEYVKRNPNFRNPTTVKYFKSQAQRGRLHPTQKPVALLEYLIKTYTLEGETVLDFTAGSFSTGVACVNTNRNFIGIEKDKSYYDIGCERVQKAINDAQEKYLQDTEK